MIANFYKQPRINYIQEQYSNVERDEVLWKLSMKACLQ